jgi:ribosomal protein L37AE/L43A
VKVSSLASRPDALVCPHCEAGGLPRSSHGPARCDSCASVVNEAMLEALRQITALADAIGAHACECGHPEMRHLPDGIYHCPACGSEVLPLGTPPVDWKSSDRGEAYWAGWLDGSFGGSGSFADNPYLARWEDPSGRLDYYRGHRAGSEAGRTGYGQPSQPRQESRLSRCAMDCIATQERRGRS